MADKDLNNFTPLSRVKYGVALFNPFIHIKPLISWVYS